MLNPDTAEGLIEVLYQEIQKLKEQKKVLQDENLTLGSMYEHERLHNKAIKDMGGGNLEWLHELVVEQSNQHYKIGDERRRPPKAEDRAKLIKLIRFMCPGTDLMAAKALVDEWEKTGSLHMQLIFEYDERGVDRFGVKVKTRKQTEEDHDALVESIQEDILEDLKENALQPGPTTFNACGVVLLINDYSKFWGELKIGDANKGPVSKILVYSGEVGSETYENVYRKLKIGDIISVKGVIVDPGAGVRLHARELAICGKVEDLHPNITLPEETKSDIAKKWADVVQVEDVKVSLPPPPSTGIPKREEMRVQAPILHYTDISFGGPPLDGEFLAQVDWDELDPEEMNEDCTPLKVSPKTKDKGPLCYIIKPPSFFQGAKWLLVRVKRKGLGGMVFDFVYEVTEKVVE